MKAYIGLDIGGTKIEGVLWRGKIMAAERIRTPRRRPEFLEAVQNLVARLSAKEKIAGIGVGTAGALDMKKGLVVNSPNLPFLSNLVLVRLIAKKFRAPVLMDNDTNCFLRGEMIFGLARGKRNVVALTLGTGVGGALLVEGNLVHGYHGGAGEVGHVILETKNKFHSVEDLFSSHAFDRYGAADPLDFQRRAQAGDRGARKIYETMGKYLGVTLANMVNLFDPELIILGGGIARAGDLLLIPAKAEMKKHTILPRSYLPPIKISKLKYAAALGAVSLFLSKKAPN